MGDWIRVLRLPATLLGGWLVLVAFKVAGNLKAGFLPACATFVIQCVMMAQNDWADRVHDEKKGKQLAIREPVRFRIMLVALWSVVFVVTAIAADKEPRMLFIFLVGIGWAIFHSHTRLVPGLYLGGSVAVVASTTFLPSAGGYGVPSYPLALAVACVIASREILKDIEDQGIDRGHKWTIPTRFSNRVARELALSLALLGFLAASLIRPIALVGVPCVALAAQFLFREEADTAKRFLDVGIIFSFIGLMAFA